MSIAFHVFARREQVPTGSQWAQAMRELGPAAPDTDFDPLACNGYLPCPDQRCGFELYVEPYSCANIEFGPSAREAIGEADVVMTFRLSGRDLDLAAARSAAASLTALSDGVLFDPATQHYVAANSALHWARDEPYRPVAVHHARARRRRARFRLATGLRLLLLIAVAASFLFLYRT